MRHLSYIATSSLESYTCSKDLYLEVRGRVKIWLESCVAPTKMIIQNLPARQALLLSMRRHRWESRYFVVPLFHLRLPLLSQEAEKFPTGKKT